MADEIRQKMGFDVSEALSNLADLRASLGKTSTSLSTLAKNGSQITALGKNVAGSLGTATTAVNNFGSQTAQAAQSATPHLSNLTVSFETLSRVIATQFVVRALSVMRNAIKDSIGDFIEFQTAIAEIETIGSSVGSFNQLSDAVLNISNSFNIPLLDAARGTYEAISNQVVKTAGDLDFLDEAALFSKATNSSFAQSVDLLSGALNAYGQTTEQTGKLASQFFKTIELGKVRADELVSAFGRVAPIADTVGISTGELNAALAALTIGGVKASEAGTQLRGILVELVKPSDAMKAAFKELGVATAEELIQAKGLLGSLEALNGTTNGASQEIAALFNNVRALTGELRLTGRGLQSFADDQKKIIEANDTLSTQKGLDVLAKSGQQVAKAWREVGNIFTTEVGSGLVSAAAAALDLAGGVQGVVSLGKPLVGLFTDASIAAGSLALTFGLARANAFLLNKELTLSQKNLLLFGQTVAGIQIAQFAGENIGNLISAFQLKSVNAQLEGAKEAIAVEKQTVTKRLEILDTMIAAAKSRNAEEIIALRQKSNEELDIVQQSADAQKDALSESLNVVLDAQKQRVNDLRKVSTDAKNAIEQSLDRSTKLKANLQDQKFAQNLVGLTDPQKFNTILGNAAKTLSLAKGQFLKSTDPKTLDRAVDQFGRASDRAQEALDVAKTNGDRQGQLAAENLLLKIKKDQLSLELQIQKTLVDREKQAQVTAAKEEARTKRLSADAKTILSNFGKTTDKNGNPLSKEAQDKVNANLAEGIRQFNADSSPTEQIDLAKKLNIASLQSLIKDRLSDIEIKRITLATEAQQSIIDQFAKINFPVNAAIAKNQEDEKKVIAERNKLEKQGAIDVLNVRKEETLKFLKSLDNDTQQQSGSKTLTDRFITGFDPLQIKTISNELIQLAQNGQLSQAALTRLNDEFEKAGGNFDGIGRDDKLAQALKLSETFLGLQNQSKTATENLGKTTEEVVKPAMADVVSYAERLEAAVTNTADASQRITLPTFGQSEVERVSGKAHGGFMRYLASGGTAGRGTDSIHAMLSPGEFVVNARSSSRFFSQLQSINAGRDPVMRSQGGSATNVTIGDVNVQGGSTPSKTARTIAAELKREIRRGSARGF